MRGRTAKGSEEAISLAAAVEEAERTAEGFIVAESEVEEGRRRQEGLREAAEERRPAGSSRPWVSLLTHEDAEMEEDGRGEAPREKGRGEFFRRLQKSPATEWLAE
uniref:Uncharacterized protein n=1 Tax=Toxoplasma gondii TgCATBr9 TaxID=943120 RepID=A0A2T6IMC3_TOXGO|nr:hypothetical protein TGBR9_383590 [Toxoplasma gondii TgCATBr9]